MKILQPKFCSLFSRHFHQGIVLPLLLFFKIFVNFFANNSLRATATYCYEIKFLQEQQKYRMLHRSCNPHGRERERVREREREREREEEGK